VEPAGHSEARGGVLFDFNGSLQVEDVSLIHPAGAPSSCSSQHLPPRCVKHSWRSRGLPQRIKAPLLPTPAVHGGIVCTSDPCNVRPLGQTSDVLVGRCRTTGC
jgi:hypothetical protein